MISASVGERGINSRLDVVKVQGLLKLKGADPGPADGICGNRTIAAIKKFQGRFLSRPDGRIDPNGLTLRHLMGAGPGPGPSPAPGPGPAPKPPSPAPAQDDTLTSLVSRDSIGPLNGGLTAVSNSFMFDTLGAPRESFSSDCQALTNAKLARNVTIGPAGPFRVQGLKPAVESLRAVLADVQKEQPGVYAALGTAGMLCCRFVRGSTKYISNHSWGTAIDLTINRKLDARGDGKVQYGLTLIAPIFNRHGWYWGAAFPTEDAMHFEGGRSLVETWKNQLT